MNDNSQDEDYVEKFVPYWLLGSPFIGIAIAYIFRLDFLGWILAIAGTYGVGLLVFPLMRGLEVLRDRRHQHLYEEAVQLDLAEAAEEERLFVERQQAELREAEIEQARIQKELDDQKSRQNTEAQVRAFDDAIAGIGDAVRWLRKNPDHTDHDMEGEIIAQLKEITRLDVETIFRTNPLAKQDIEAVKADIAELQIRDRQLENRLAEIEAKAGSNIHEFFIQGLEKKSYNK